MMTPETAVHAPEHGRLRRAAGEPAATMRAAMISQYGPPSVLRVGTMHRPRPQRGQVLIRVHAAGINPIDYRIRQGQLKWLLPGNFPLVLGYDVAGEVAEVGEDVPAGKFKIGDPVMAFLGSRHGGGYAEYVAAQWKVVVGKPDNLSMQDAAAIPLAATTALVSLRDHGRIRAGCQVLVNGASGGVGHFAVQIAKAFEATVTGVCSGANQQFTSALGADHVIDYAEEDFTQQRAQYDIIFDAVAMSSWWRCRGALKPGGTYITTVPTPLSLVLHGTTWFGRKCRFVLARPHPRDLQFLSDLAGKGLLRPELQEVFQLDRAAEAHRVSEAHHVRGKLVLQIGS